jgi:hypothetical protein
MNLKYLLLLLVVLFPQMYDNNQLLLKTFFVMMFGVLWLDPHKIKAPEVPSDVWRLLKIMFVISTVGLIASIHAPLWRIGLFGCDGRVDGLIPMMAIGFVVWLGFWAMEKEPNLPLYCRVMQTITLICLGVLLFSRPWFYRFSMTDMGIGMLVPQFIPLLAILCITTRITKKFNWFALACAVALVAISGSRSGMIAVFLGLTVTALYYYPKYPMTLREEFREKAKTLGLILLIVGCIAFAIPGMRNRILSIDPDHFGQGPRSYLAMKLLESGTPLLGYGFGQQRLIIGVLPQTCTEAKGFEWDRWFNCPGFYDRFHVWFLDAISDVGTFGLGMILVGLFFVFRTAWQLRGEPWVAGFAGSLAAYIVVCSFNPPTTVITLFGALSAAGIYIYSTAPKVSILKTHRAAWCFLVMGFVLYGVLVYRNFRFCIEWISLSRLPVSP